LGTEGENCLINFNNLFQEFYLDPSVAPKFLQRMLFLTAIWLEDKLKVMFQSDLFHIVCKSEKDSVAHIKTWKGSFLMDINFGRGHKFP
jgi:hypothetical protein